jgi:hypothetical protein
MNDDDPFFDKIPPPIRLPEIIPIEAVSDEQGEMWDQLLRRRMSPRILVLVLSLVLTGSLSTAYLNSQSTSPFELAVDQLPATNPSVRTPSTKISSALPTTVPATPAASSATILASAVEPCSLATTTDATNGYTLGLPPGWFVSLNHGVLFASPTSEFQTAVFMLPIRLMDPNLVESVTKTVTNVLLQYLEAFGLKIVVNESDMTGLLRDVALSGRLETRYSDTELLVSGGWSPTSDWPTIQLTLRNIINCYQTVPGTVLRTISKTLTDEQATSVFSASHPDTWVMTNLSSTGFDLETNGETVLRYQRHGGVLGDKTATGLIEQTLASLNYQELTPLAESLAREVVDNQGVTWQVQTRSYTARSGNRVLRGIVTAAVATSDYGFGFGSSTTITILSESDLTVWPSFAPLQAAVQESLVLTSPQAGQGLRLAAADPAVAPSPLDGTGVASALRETVGDAAQVLLTTYQTAKTKSGALFLVPLANFQPDPVFIYDHDGLREELEMME